MSKELADLMVKQIAHELKNHNLYRSMANYFSVEGIRDLEDYFNKRAHEEYNHHEWLSHFLSEADVKYVYPAVDMNEEKFTDYVTPFTQTVDREIQTTQMLYAIFEQATSEKDHMTASWLYDKLIKEQIEEENVSRMARTIMEEENVPIYDRAEQVLELLGS
jgi:ferritin